MLQEAKTSGKIWLEALGICFFCPYLAPLKIALKVSYTLDDTQIYINFVLTKWIRRDGNDYGRGWGRGSGRCCTYPQILPIDGI